MGQHHSIEEYKAALHKYRGRMYLVAEALDLWPSAVIDRVSKSPELKAVRALYRGRLTDVAVTHLEAAVAAGEPWAVKYQLDAHGEDEGYGSPGSGSNPLCVQVIRLPEGVPEP